MIRRLGGIVGSALRVLLVVLLVSVLGSLAVTTGAVDVGLADGERIETPDPIPDWPFTWEIPIGDDPEQYPEPGSEPGDEPDVGDPVREDPGSTSFESRETVVTSEEIEERVHERVNSIRADNELPSVAHDDRIAGISRTHSHDMAEREYFSHVSPEGESPADRFGELYPSECRAVGENIAFVGTVSADDADAVAERIVGGWMDSEPHRENILTARWDSQGIGVYVDGDRVYATQKFCDRR